MQDITKAKCSSSSIANGTEGRLIDKRDNKIYWVAKLADGLCWMTQNLDYDGGAVSGYSGSDVATLTAGTSFTESTQSQKLYYNPGDYVYTLESVVNNCANQELSIGLSGCINNGWRNVEGMIASPDPNYPNILDAIDENTYLYNAHYLIGNYYNWMAATNGTGSSVTTDGVSASGSICPTGWSLPLSWNNNNSSDGSFYKLLNGLKGTDITVAPYYFVYGGWVNSSTLNSASNNGYYWSATVYGKTNAFYMNFNNGSVSPSLNTNRYYGHSVRCVAR